jgi:hypothetical protein
MKRSLTLLGFLLSTAACSSNRTGMTNGVVDGAPIDAGTDDWHGTDPDSADIDIVVPEVGGMEIGDIDAEVSGGGAHDSDGPIEPLCDGMAHLRLWALIAPRDEVRGSMVRVENGLPFIAIDGTCSYWLGGGWTDDPLSRDRPIRTGKMTDADVALVERAVPLGDMSNLGDCPSPPAGLFDYSYKIIRVATTEKRCFTGAPSLTAGTRFESAWSVLEEMAGRACMGGTPLDGALHVSAVDATAGGSMAAYTWPIPFPLSSVVLQAMDWMKAGVSRSLDDPDSVRELRALRDRYLSDRTAQPGLFANWDGLKVADQTGTAYVYMRDATPYEDEHGLLTF